MAKKHATGLGSQSPSHVAILGTPGIAEAARLSLPLANTHRLLVAAAGNCWLFGLSVVGYLSPNEFINLICWNCFNKILKTVCVHLKILNVQCTWNKFSSLFICLIHWKAEIRLQTLLWSATNFTEVMWRLPANPVATFHPSLQTHLLPFGWQLSSVVVWTGEELAFLWGEMGIVSLWNLQFGLFYLYRKIRMYILSYIIFLNKLRTITNATLNHIYVCCCVAFFIVLYLNLFIWNKMYHYIKEQLDLEFTFDNACVLYNLSNSQLLYLWTLAGGKKK